MTVTILPAFATEWGMTPATSRAAYVGAEIKRLLQNGTAVLCPVLAVLDDELRTIALELLHANSDGTDAQGQLYDPARPWRVRLVKDAKPPPVDPQGRPIHGEKAGKVLLVKTSNLGGVGGGSTNHDRPMSGRPDAGNANVRNAKLSRGDDVCRYREITTSPVTLSLNDAVLVLKRWGVGVQTRRYKMPEGFREGQAPREAGQDQWLVEEVLDAPSTNKRVP